MNDFFNIKQKQLSLQIESLIFACLQCSFAIGSSLIACTTTHFDSRTGLIAISVIPHGANHDLFDGRISFIVTCDPQSLEKLSALNTYLLDVLNNGYRKFNGFPDQPQSLPPPAQAYQSHAHARELACEGSLRPHASAISATGL